MKTRSDTPNENIPEGVVLSRLSQGTQKTPQKRVPPERKSKKEITTYADQIFVSQSRASSRSRPGETPSRALSERLNKMGLEDEEPEISNKKRVSRHALLSEAPLKDPGGRHLKASTFKRRGGFKVASSETLKVPTLVLKRADNGGAFRLANKCSPTGKGKRKQSFGVDPHFECEMDTTDSDSASSTASRRFTQSGNKRSTKHPAVPGNVIRVSPRKRPRCHLVSASGKTSLKAETLEDIRRRLHTSEIPERLPCREEEFGRICAFIQYAVARGGLSQAMYISGVPGTGKTATVLQAVRYMKSSKKCPNFDFIATNAMELSDPKQIFVEIYKEIVPTKKKIAASTARRKLNEMFQNFDPQRRPVLLLVDELDLLCTKRQDIIYDIFNWSSNEESRVSILAIANTLDLPERLLSQRVTSRLGANRLCFQPYEHDEIASIIRDRLIGSTAVDKEAVELASRKVAAVSGDLRKALDIIRRAAEVAESAGHDRLTMKHVQEAVREASTTVRVELVRSLSHHSILLLRAALSEQTNSGLDEFTFQDIMKQYRLQCHVTNTTPLPFSSAYRNAMEMCSTRLLVAAPGVGDLTRRFRLGMSAQETQFALNQVNFANF